MIGKPRRSKLFIFTLGSLLLGIFTDCGACILFAQAVGQSVPPPQAPNSSSNETTPPPVSVPEVLRSWIPWSLYDEGIKRSPSTYRNQEERIHFWPSQVDIAVDDKQGTWKVPVQVFYESWVPLPGGGENWPTQVTDGVKELVVIERNGFPSVKLKPGTYLLQGTWKWEKVPQRMLLPKSYGWVRLQLNNEPVAAPTWDENGYLWFKRAVSDEVSKDQYSFQIYRLIEDGSPIWLRTEIDLTATGRSREEELGYVLPEGWQLSYVNSSIPVAIEESGRIKVQLRAGNWKIQIDAFRKIGRAHV